MTDDSDMIIMSSSGNVFADLSLADADDLLVKANLALHIRSAIKMRKLTQAQAAKILSIDQPKLSSIVKGRLDEYSTDRLMRFLNELGCDVQISVSPPKLDARGHLLIA
jgi:predicted XRE-type DNA-binding protein